MKNKIITGKIGYVGNEHINNPTKIQFELTPELHKQIALAQKLVEEHDFDSIKVSVCADLFEGRKESDFSPECETLIVSSVYVCYYAQHKHDSSAQIEAIVNIPDYKEAPIKDEPAKVLVIVDGGIVQSVMSTDPATRYAIVDWDDQSEEEVAISVGKAEKIKGKMVYELYAGKNPNDKPVYEYLKKEKF